MFLACGMRSAGEASKPFRSRSRGSETKVLPDCSIESSRFAAQERPLQFAGGQSTYSPPHRRRRISPRLHSQQDCRFGSEVDMTPTSLPKFFQRFPPEAVTTITQRDVRPRGLALAPFWFQPSVTGPLQKWLVATASIEQVILVTRSCAAGPGRPSRSDRQSI